VTPAFERGCATLTSKKMDILDQREMVRNYKRKTDELKLEPRMEYDNHALAIVRHESNMNQYSNSNKNYGGGQNTVSLPILPHIKNGGSNDMSNDNSHFNSNFNITQQKMSRNMTENRLQT